MGVLGQEAGKASRVLYAMLKSIVEALEGFVWVWGGEDGFGIGLRMV